MHNKILIVGNFNWYFYEEALGEGFLKHGVNVINFKIPSFKILDKFLKFRALKRLNVELLDVIKFNTPDYIFFYRTNEILPSTLKSIKIVLPKTKILFYHNDNPFTGLKNYFKYFLYLNALKYSDITYVYRPSNIYQAINRGAKSVKLLYPHYCTKLHLNETVNFRDKKDDLIFIGHYEKDRGEIISELISNGINIKVYGPGWEVISAQLKWPQGVVNNPVYGKKYKQTLSNAKLALCFLSKKNEDVYTRRNFEIPASKTLVLSEYTYELSSFFEPNKEILLFKNTEDLISKVKRYLKNDFLLQELTENAYNRLIKDGHSENDRANQILKDLH